MHSISFIIYRNISDSYLFVVFLVVLVLVAAVAAIPPVYKFGCHCFCGSLTVKHLVLSVHLPMW